MGLDAASMEPLTSAHEQDFCMYPLIPVFAFLFFFMSVSVSEKQLAEQCNGTVVTI